jgi:hypothetical protein
MAIPTLVQFLNSGSERIDLKVWRIISLRLVCSLVPDQLAIALLITRLK